VVKELKKEVKRSNYKRACGINNGKMRSKIR